MNTRDDRVAELVSGRGQLEVIQHRLETVATDLTALRATLDSVIGSSPATGPPTDVAHAVIRMHNALAETRSSADALYVSLGEMRPLL